MDYDPKDPDVIGLIARSYGRTFGDIADEVRRQFPNRAWPVEAIANYVHMHRWPLFGGRYQRDAEIMAFIADRADIMPLEEILRQGLDQFGEERFPARSTLHRLFSNVRKAAREKAALSAPASSTPGPR